MAKEPETAVATTGQSFLDTLDPRVANALASQGITEAPIEVHDVEELTGGWRQLNKEGKRRLIGVPFTIVKMSFNDSDFKVVDGNPTAQFVVLHIVTDEKEPQFFVVVDGGTGIYESAQRWVSRYGDPTGHWIKCPNGLRVSDYTYKNEDGETSPASTYYFD